MKIQPADIIITADKKSWFSKAILCVLNFFQKDEVKYQHVMMAITDEVCVEALNKITTNFTRERFKDFKRFKIIRCESLSMQQKHDIVLTARGMIGYRYGYIRLALQLFDQIFNTNWFTKRIKDPDYQICSSFIAFCYDKEAGIRFNGLSWAAVEPDDIDDESLRSDTQFKTIYEWEMT